MTGWEIEVGEGEKVEEKSGREGEGRKCVCTNHKNLCLYLDHL